MKVKNVISLPVVVLIFLSGIKTSFGQSIPEEARRHFDRGMAAVEMTKSPADYEKAITEFEKTKSLAPNWADIYYNLGLVLEKAEKYGDAAMNLKQYLHLAPNAGDAEAVKSHINMLEYKAEHALTESDIVDVLVSFSNKDLWIKSGRCVRDDSYLTLMRGGLNTVRVMSFFSPEQGRKFSTLKVEDPIIRYTARYREWALDDPYLVRMFGTEENPTEHEIEVVSREHVIVKQKTTLVHKGQVDFYSCEYFKK